MLYTEIRIYSILRNGDNLHIFTDVVDEAITAWIGTPSSANLVENLAGWESVMADYHAIAYICHIISLHMLHRLVATSALISELSNSLQH